MQLIGAVLLEQNDEGQLEDRQMQVEMMAALAAGRSRRSLPDPMNDLDVMSVG